jgi:hypothetical protein
MPYDKLLLRSQHAFLRPGKLENVPVKDLNGVSRKNVIDEKVDLLAEVAEPSG